MHVHTSAPPPLILLVGAAFLAGACALAWLSSLDVMTITRTGADSADVAFEDRLFGVVAIAGERFAGVRAARSVVPRLPGSTSRTSSASFLAFDTPNGQVFAEADRHYFRRHADDITAFIADPARAKLVIRQTDEARELVRFLVAQACVVVLAVVGAFLIHLGVRGLFPDTNAGIGPA
jgi:hypothetical protein